MRGARVAFGRAFKNTVHRLNFPIKKMACPEGRTSILSTHTKETVGGRYHLLSFAPTHGHVFLFCGFLLGFLVELRS